MSSIDERGTTCCYAKQDKFWVEGSPDGERWEIYTVLADSPSFFAEDVTTSAEAGCCAADAAETETVAAGAPACC